MESLGLMFAVIIATGIVYLAHLQRRILDIQESLVGHFIDLIKHESHVPPVVVDEDILRKVISLKKEKNG